MHAATPRLAVIGIQGTIFSEHEVFRVYDFKIVFILTVLSRNNLTKTAVNLGQAAVKPRLNRGRNEVRPRLNLGQTKV